MHSPTTKILLLIPWALAPLAAGCGGDEDSSRTPVPQADAGDGDLEPDGGEADQGTLPEEPFFAFGTSPDQPISAAPFPSDLYRQPDGTLRLASLAADPRLGGLARPETLQLLDACIAGRTGFGSTGSLWLFTREAPDLSSLEGRVRLITLEGPEAGREVAVQTFWQERAGAIGVYPAWGDYLMPGSGYALLVTAGVRTAGGEEVVPPPALAGLLAKMETDSPGESPPAGLRQRWAPLRAWLGQAGLDPGQVLVASVFTTEEVLPLGRAVLDAVDRFPLVPPTRRVRYDLAARTFEEAPPTEEAELDAYFGRPLPPFEHNPGIWWRAPGSSETYRGGTGHFGIGRVVHGSIVVPSFNLIAGPGGPTPAPLRFDEDGLPVASLEALVPFTLYLCRDQLADPSRLPVAVFSHGGNATRSDAAAWASGNCRAGVATVAIDMIFHGGRRLLALQPDSPLVVPVTPDVLNYLSFLRQGDPGYLRDWVGDPGDAVDSAGALFAIWQMADPRLIEANLLTVSADTATLLRYLREGDWSRVQPGLSFDPQKIFHESLSFGTAFHTPLIALRDDFAGVVGSVGAGSMLSLNLMMGPHNSALASAVVRDILGLQSSLEELTEHSWTDPVLGLHQWLHERGDGMPWAPHVLRHRPTPDLPPLLHTCDSWDETLYAPAQVSYAVALGLPSYTHGADWTVDPTLPGAARLLSTPAPAEPLSGNVSYEGRTGTAAIFWWAHSGHGLAHDAQCSQSFVHPYPPIRSLPESLPLASPICELHAQLGTFLGSLLEGGPARIVRPEGRCADLYP